MAAGEDGDHQLLDDVVLADDDAGHLLAQAPMSLLQPGQILQIGRQIVGATESAACAIRQSRRRSGIHHMALGWSSEFYVKPAMASPVRTCGQLSQHSTLVNRQELIW